jgi:hypothetical protein
MAAMASAGRMRLLPVPGDQIGGAGGHGHAREVAQIAPRGGEIEPMVLGQLGGHEAGHRRLATQRQHTPGGFAERPNQGGRTQRYFPGHGWFAETGEQSVDPVPEEDRLAVGDEVGASSGAAARVFVTYYVTKTQGGLGEEVGVDGIFDVDEVHAVLAGADDAEAAGAGAGQHAGDEMRVADAPDQVRAEGDGGERRGVGGEDLVFGDGLGQRIRTRARGGERERLIRVREGAAVVDHAGRAGVDEVFHAMLAGAFEQGAGAEDIGAVKIGVAAPDTNLGGGVENGLDARAGRADGVGVIERGADEADAAGLQFG